MHREESEHYERQGAHLHDRLNIDVSNVLGVGMRRANMCTERKCE